MSMPHVCYHISLEMNRRQGTRLELMHDRDMVAMIEGAIRGGMTLATTRHVKLEEPYSPERPGFILNLDANNLVSGGLIFF